MKIKVDLKTAKVLKEWLDISEKYKKASDKVLMAEAQRMLRKSFVDGQKALANMEARRLAKWLKAQRD